MIRSFKGKTPKVHPTAFVSEFAYVVGDVEIGPGASVWPGAVVRGDVGRITVGRNTVIQDNCVVHMNTDSRIGDGALLGHGVVWHGSVLGDNCMVGNNATVMGDVEVGPDAVIAAGALLLERAKVPGGSLVMGVPAKVVGPATEKQRAFVRRAVAHYAREAQEFKADGL